MQKKIFTLSTEIYSDEKIQSAIEDFQEVSEMSFANGELSIQGQSEEEIQEIFHEFMNYILSI